MLIYPTKIKITLPVIWSFRLFGKPYCQFTQCSISRGHNTMHFFSQHDQETRVDLRQHTTYITIWDEQASYDGSAACAITALVQTNRTM